jgi:glucokinase
MDYTNDSRVVLTLDAGGTNFVFSAMQGMKEVATPVRLPSCADDLDKSLDSMVQGFSQLIEQLDVKPVAISFAFPGPADYPSGIITTPPNMPAYHGVALGPFLQEKFQMPVFINNDGDLFVYGEAIGGFLNKVNKMLKDAGSPKQYNKLFGITLGTGFGGGLVVDGNLYVGDNSAAGEIWITRNKRNPKCFAEEGVSIRAVKGSYARITGIDVSEAPEPKDIYEIGLGNKEGNKDAALQAFAELGEVVGDALSNAMTLLDGLVVIGGGLSNAYPLFIDSILKEMNGTIESYDGDKLPRMPQKSFDLENPDDQKLFLKGEVQTVKVLGTDKTIQLDSMKRIGIGRAVLDTSHAVSVGAYSFALNALDK